MVQLPQVCICASSLAKPLKSTGVSMEPLPLPTQMLWTKARAGGTRKTLRPCPSAFYRAKNVLHFWVLCSNGQSAAVLSVYYVLISSEGRLISDHFISQATHYVSRRHREQHRYERCSCSLHLVSSELLWMADFIRTFLMGVSAVCAPCSDLTENKWNDRQITKSQTNQMRLNINIY